MSEVPLPPAMQHDVRGAAPHGTASAEVLGHEERCLSVQTRRLSLQTPEPRHRALHRGPSRIRAEAYSTREACRTRASPYRGEACGPRASPYRGASPVLGEAREARCRAFRGA